MTAHVLAVDDAPGERLHERRARGERVVAGALHDHAGLCFVPCRDGRPQGLAGLDIVCTDKAAVLGALAAHGIEHDGAQFITGGMRWRLL